MCNLYSLTKSQDAIRRLFRVTKDSAGNMPSLPGIFPNYLAPVVRAADGGRELVMMYWGMPNPPQIGGYSTNIRHVASPHWRRWTKPQHRCLVPATSFCEYAPEPNPETGKKDVIWFALSPARPLFAFAGIWTEWTGARGPIKKPIVDGAHLAYAFLTCAPNAVVKPIHPQAMPVLLHERDWEDWLTLPATEAVALQRPWPDDELQIVARGSAKEDVG